MPGGVGSAVGCERFAPNGDPCQAIAWRSLLYLREERQVEKFGEMQQELAAAAVCTENLIRVDEVMESPKLAQ